MLNNSDYRVGEIVSSILPIRMIPLTSGTNSFWENKQLYSLSVTRFLPEKYFFPSSVFPEQLPII